MAVYISDLPYCLPRFNINDTVIENRHNISACRGCFKCWSGKQPNCVISDGLQQTGELLGTTEQLTIISECCFGGYSPFVKNVLDRAISYVRPEFTIKYSKIRHKRRYQNHIRLTAVFYGENITAAEKETAKMLVNANAENLDATVEKIVFADSKGESIYENCFN